MTYTYHIKPYYDNRYLYDMTLSGFFLERSIKSGQ